MKPNQLYVIFLACVTLLMFSLIAIAPNTNAMARQSMVTSKLASEIEPPCNSNRSIQVSGTAVVYVVPDRALVQLGVQTNGSTPGGVALANTLAIQKVIESMQILGIEPKDISTDLYIVEPIYENYDSLAIKGYRINNIVAVTVRDVTKTSKLIVAALQSGANQIIKVEFYTSELRKFRDQARELAMIAASEKARALATSAGAETGCVLNITENSYSSYYGAWNSGRDPNLWAQNTTQNVLPAQPAESSAESEPLSLGKISVRSEVGLTLSLK
ncbi:MAG: SIMPL domain-containing protein [Chloroflexi bacterium]|nr:SIMPL domain-containing protein [Chloroflexota bacterium]